MMKTDEVEMITLKSDSTSEGNADECRMSLYPKHRKSSQDSMLGEEESSSDDSLVQQKKLPTTNNNNNSKLASDFKTFGNTIISFVGSGILGLPYAFRKSGILLGICSLIFISSVSTYCMLLILKCKYRLKTKGHDVTKYGQVAFHAVGKWGTLAVDCSLVVTQCGFCIAYLIFIATNLHALFGFNAKLVVLCCVPALVRLAFLSHLKQLAPVALFADFANFFGLAVVYVSDFEYMPLDHDEIHYSTFLNLPFFFGVAIYCFEGVGMVLPLENSMKNKSKFEPLLISTVVLITTVYATFGICGYLAFGDETKDVITLNMPGSIISKIVKVSLCVGLYCTYPMMLFPVFEVLEPVVLSSSQTDRKRKIFRGILVIITAIFAVGIPNFGLFISFIGSTCCSLLAFILPSIFYWRLFGESISLLNKLFLVIIMVIGLMAIFIGVKDALGHIF